VAVLVFALHASLADFDKAAWTSFDTLGASEEE
jgi:hypothetical protein